MKNMKIQNLTPAQRSRADQLSRMTPKEWDAICKHCGLRCLFKLECLLSSHTRYLDLCCAHLNLKTHKCNVYNKRHSMCRCKSIDIQDILANEILPATCGYVEYVFGPATEPIAVDFNKIPPIDDSVMNDMGYFSLRRHTIRGSKKWNHR